MLTVFATDTANTIGVLQIVVPTGVALLVALFGGWAVVAKYQQKIDDAKDDIKELKKDVSSLKTKLAECSTRLEERTANSLNRVVKRKSPLSLTPYGEKILDSIEGKKYVLDNKDKLVAAIKDKHPKSAYDVQEYARQVIESMQDTDEFVPFKDYAFREGLSLEFITAPLSIFLRDVALPVLGFTPQQLDESDPDNKK